MNTDLEAVVKAALYRIAPDLEGEPLDPKRRFRDQFEFDSMDLLRYMVELHQRTGIDIPEADYPQLESLDSAVTWLRAAGVR